jgi:hypothetical protein
MLNPLDQFIASRVKARFAAKEASTRVAADNYPKEFEAVKLAAAAIAGLTQVSQSYGQKAKSALDDFAKVVDSIPSELKKLGTDPNIVKRYHTQLVNLIKAAQDGHPLRAYSPFDINKPIYKAQKVSMLLAQAVAKSKDQTELNQYLRTVMLPLDTVTSTCASWYKLADKTSQKIDKLISKSKVTPKPLGDEYDEYTDDQRSFSAAVKTLVDVIRHNAIGLPEGRNSFADCADVELCIKSMERACVHLLKIFTEFKKNWSSAT